MRFRNQQEKACISAPTYACGSSLRGIHHCGTIIGVEVADRDTDLVLRQEASRCNLIHNGFTQLMPLLVDAEDACHGAKAELVH